MQTTNPKTFLDRISWTLTRHRRLVVSVIAILTVFFLYGATKVKDQVLLQDMLPYDHPYLKLQGQFAQVFGTGGSTVAIALHAKQGDIFTKKTLTKIKQMTEEVEMLDEVYRLLTVSIASHQCKVVKTKAKGEISISPLMFPDVPQTEAEIQALKSNIFASATYNGIFVSEDGTSSLLLTEFKENISYLKTFGILRGLVKKYSDAETSIHIVGYPMLMGWIFDAKASLFFVFVISIVAMALVLILIYFRSLLGMIVVASNAIVLTIWGLGFIGYTGINFNPLFYVLAFLVGARMVGNAHQITYRYFEELTASNGDRAYTCYETMRTMFIPNFTAVITDSAGFLVLVLIKIALMQQLALIMTFWMLSIILTGFMVPAMCDLIPLKAAKDQFDKETCQYDRLALFIMKISNFAIGRGKYAVTMVLVAVTVFCGWKLSQLKIGDPTPGSSIFYASHQYNQDQAFINERFKASSENLVLFYQGKPNSVYDDPAVLQMFDEFRVHMEEQLPDIYKSSSSLINMSKQVNLTLHDGDQVWYQLPTDPNTLRSLVGYVRMAAGTTTLLRFVDTNMQKAQLILFFANHTSDNLLRIRNAAYAFFEDHPRKLESGEFMLAGGRIGMEIGLNEEMKRSHMTVDLIVLLAIFCLCAFSFRSIAAAVMLTLPLILANAVAGAYMSMANIGLSINTLPIAAIGVGVGVDFAIYLYSRAREEYPLQGGDWKGTITQSMCTCGKAVVFTGMTIVLPIITWYFFSDMKFQAQVGFFLAMIMTTNVLLVMTLHPLMIYVFKPKFISGAMKRKSESSGLSLETAKKTG